ncbi:hypothetical protein T459_11513 [Capsicum annuum]|uniref:Uncharacterized protein n=1 Tax=Capsicum annuum TaxID=4072 RepID=A0A2G2ZM45_CAPAN|nr:hypothetical protein T459_11513 [Capsicum annuum]
MATSSKFNHIRSNESKVETMHDGLLGLEELYKSVNYLLNLPQDFQFFSQHQRKKWVKDLLDKSMRLLDVCSAIRELVLQCKENVRDLQLALIRSKGDLTTEAIMVKFASSCRKIIKEAKKLVLCKENVIDLQFTLKRSKEDSTIEAIMIKFASSCKKIKNEAKKTSAM